VLATQAGAPSGELGDASTPPRGASALAGVASGCAFDVMLPHPSAATSSSAGIAIPREQVRRVGIVEERRQGRIA
jgi:hypothetical protein